MAKRIRMNGRRSNKECVSFKLLSPWQLALLLSWASSHCNSFWPASSEKFLASFSPCFCLLVYTLLRSSLSFRLQIVARLFLLYRRFSIALATISKVMWCVMIFLSVFSESSFLVFFSSQAALVRFISSIRLSHNKLIPQALLNLLNRIILMEYLYIIFKYIFNHHNSLSLV